MLPQDMGAAAFATEEIERRRGGNWMVRTATRLKLWGSYALARFPANNVINVKTICEADQHFGPLVEEYVARGVLDERTALQLFLVLHRSLEQQSPYHPYIQGLPSGAELPVNFADEMLEELAGTEAYDAVHVRIQGHFSAFLGSEVHLVSCDCTVVDVERAFECSEWMRVHWDA